VHCFGSLHDQGSRTATIKLFIISLYTGSLNINKLWLFIHSTNKNKNKKIRYETDTNDDVGSTFDW